MEKLWLSTSSGHIELQITLEDAETGSHQGRCDEDIDYLLTVPYIAEQLDAIDPETLKKELDEYGAWDENELADHDQNKARLLWLACGDIVEENRAA